MSVITLGGLILFFILIPAIIFVIILVLFRIDSLSKALLIVNIPLAFFWLIAAIAEWNFTGLLIFTIVIFILDVIRILKKPKETKKEIERVQINDL
ncbi:MAG: hypothetical protein PHP32_05770 [Candidatus Izemoplasmatales bacterium]|nr:hypothetical protein [Candidatus Izemoplasmatales bacterium]